MDPSREVSNITDVNLASCKADGGGREPTRVTNVRSREIRHLHRRRRGNDLAHD